MPSSDRSTTDDPNIDVWHDLLTYINTTYLVARTGRKSHTNPFDRYHSCVMHLESHQALPTIMRIEDFKDDHLEWSAKKAGQFDQIRQEEGRMLGAAILEMLEEMQEELKQARMPSVEKKALQQRMRIVERKASSAASGWIY